MLARISRAFGECVDIARFNAVSANTDKKGFFSFGTTARYEDLHRLKTMAKLGENLFQIQIQIEEYRLSHETLAAAATQSHAEGTLSENDMYIMYRRIRELELQQMALNKSERIIRVTLTGLDNQATIKKMRHVLAHTVSQHNMLHANGMLETESEMLMESYEQVSQHISQGQSVLDNIDAQNDEFEVDAHLPGDEITQDTAYSRWKQEFFPALAAPSAAAAAAPLSLLRPPAPAANTM